MVHNPERHFPQVARAGGDCVTFHVEVADDPAATIALAREHGLGVGVALNPQTDLARAAVAAGADLCLCMSINPGTPAGVHAGRPAPVRELRDLLPPEVHVQVDGGVGGDNIRTVREAGASLLVAGTRSSPGRPAAGLPAPGTSPGVSLERALELAAAARGRAYPNPTVGAVMVFAGEVVGEGVTEEYGGRHAEIHALDAAGDRDARPDALPTIEPCSHHGRTPPCVERVLAAGIARVVAGSLDPIPRPAAGSSASARRASRSSSSTRREARRQNEAWRTWAGSAVRSLPTRRR